MSWINASTNSSTNEYDALNTPWKSVAHDHGVQQAISAWERDDPMHAVDTAITGSKPAT
jgi:hypothetical protein